jgi:hypothetical protein
MSSILDNVLVLFSSTQHIGMNQTNTILSQVCVRAIQYGGGLAFLYSVLTLNLIICLVYIVEAYRQDFGTGPQPWPSWTWAASSSLPLMVERLLERQHESYMQRLEVIT